jgi:DNA polymerase-3 subunit gamma/tau
VLQRVALAQTLPEAVDDSHGDRDAVLDLAGRLAPEDVQLYYQVALIGRRDLPLAPDPRGGFEMVMLRMLVFRPAEQAGEPATGRQAGPKPMTVSKPKAAPLRRPEAPGTTASPVPAAAGTGGADEWAAIIDRLPLKGMLRQMALNCAFHGIEDDRVRLSMETAHAHLLNPARLKQLEAALCEAFGRTLKVDLASEQSLANESPAQRAARELSERQQRAVDSITADANVKALQDTFGATLFEDTIRPRD